MKKICYGKLFIAFILFILISGCRWFPEIIENGPEIFFNSFQVTNSLGNARDPVLVWADEQWGVVWEKELNTNRELYLTTIKSNGSVIDELQLLEKNYYVESSNCLWTGKNYAVVCSVYDRNDSQYKIILILASPDNIIEKTMISITSDLLTYPSIAWNGKSYSIVWADTNEGITDFDIYCSIVFFNSEGQSVINKELNIPKTGKQLHPYIVWNGKNYACIWQSNESEYNRIYFSFFDSDMDIIGEIDCLSSPSLNAYHPKISSSGNEYVICWEYDIEGNFEIYCEYIDSNGNKSGGTIKNTDSSGKNKYPSIKCGVDEYGIVWQKINDQHSGLYFTVVDKDNEEVKEPVCLLQNSDQLDLFSPSIAWDGKDFGIVWSAWSSYQENNYEIYFAY